MSYLATILTFLSMSVVTETDQDKLLNQCIYLTELGTKTPHSELKYITPIAIEICAERFGK